jgi:hypothetical protein
VLRCPALTSFIKTAHGYPADRRPLCILEQAAVVVKVSGCFTCFVISAYFGTSVKQIVRSSAIFSMQLLQLQQQLVGYYYWRMS